MTDIPPPIVIFTTGGTIDKAYFDATSSYQIGESQIARILAVAKTTYPLRIVELMRKDSLDLDAADRIAIVKAVAAAPEHRVIVTHGTDTMTDTATGLAAITGKTIVLVGALSPARFNDSDAAFNLGMAVAAVQTAPPGVYITMNGTVFDAARVTKNRERGIFEPAPAIGSRS